MCRYRFGIEEEYFVVRRKGGALVCELPRDFMAAAKRRLRNHLTHEILQSQIEVVTAPMTGPEEARAALHRFRSILAEVGRAHGVGIVAAGTHPLAYPEQQRATAKPRYATVIDELGMVGLGNALCALHVHVEVPEPDARVAIMHRLVPFLPLLLALSTSSPFWSGYDTGLLGYRNAANDALPRTGFPEMFESLQDYQSYIDAAVHAGIIKDATYVWWALRPSLQHPTLELRLTDCCTSVDDAVAIASLYRAMVHRVVRDRTLHGDFSAVTRALSEENRWRAQRYGTDGTYVDVGTHRPRSFAALLEDTVALLQDDIATLGLEREIEHLRLVMRRGTSAHLQRRVYHSAVEAGRSHRQALHDLSHWLRRCSEAGTFVPASPAPRRSLRASAGARRAA